MLETQQINRAIAEALTALGFAEGLAWKAVVVHASCKARDRLDEVHWEPPVIIVEKGVYRCGVTGPTWVCNGEIEPQDVELIPHNFTDPRYLLPALEAWTDKKHAGWTLWKWQVKNDSPSTTHAASVFIVYGDRWEGASNEPFEALRNAFSAALGVNI